MKSWNFKTHEYIETPEKQVDFMAEIEAICKKYDLSISHEDRQGAFEIEIYKQGNIDWLKTAFIKWL